MRLFRMRDSLAPVARSTAVMRFGRLVATRFPFALEFGDLRSRASLRQTNSFQEGIVRAASTTQKPKTSCDMLLWYCNGYTKFV